MSKNSIYIILNQYKKEHITEEEAVTLLEDIFNEKTHYIPSTITYPWVTYENTFPTYETTCTDGKGSVSKM